MREALLARASSRSCVRRAATTRKGNDKRKDKILELYLNHIYLGHGRYGIEEAARDDFGKSARELTIAEAAMLAGIPAGPRSTRRSAISAKALERRAFVLEQMHAKHFINDAQYEAAKNEPVRLAPTHEIDSELAPEAVQIAKKLLLELEPERGPRGGFTITTTIDPASPAARAQGAARQRAGVRQAARAARAAEGAGASRRRPKGEAVEGRAAVRRHAEVRVAQGLHRRRDGDGRRRRARSTCASGPSSAR